MCAKVYLRVDFESVLAHFEFQIYQSKKKINFAMYQSKKNNFYNVSEKISHCIRVNFIIYQRKFNTVSEQILSCIRAS